MKNEHLQFVTEYMRLKDKEAAYKIAYPDCQPESAYSSAKRLLTRPDIKEYLDETYGRMRKEAEEEVKEKMKGEIISAHTAQVVLSQIIMGQHTIPKEVNVKGRLETIEVRPTHSAIISALNAFFRLNGMYPAKGAKPKIENNESPVPPKMPAGLEEIMQRINDRGGVRAHPYGDTYPSHYRGPYYDPGDPNTREMFLDLMERFRKEALEKGEPIHMYEEHLNGTAINPYSLDGKTPYFHDWKDEDQALLHQGRHFEGTEKSPQHLDEAGASDQQQHRNSGHYHVAEPPHNDDHFSATISNNAQESSFPVLREGGPQGRKGYTQQEQSATISNNPLQPSWIPLDGGYQHIDRLMAYCYADCLQDKPGSKDLYEKLKLMDKCKNMSPDIVLRAEASSGWQYHPAHRRLIRPKLLKNGGDAG